jgi:hypothetical protein
MPYPANCKVGTLRLLSADGERRPAEGQEQFPRPRARCNQETNTDELAPAQMENSSVILPMITIAGLPFFSLWWNSCLTRTRSAAAGEREREVGFTRDKVSEKTKNTIQLKG